MKITFGQLFVELEALKKSDPKMLEGDLVVQGPEGLEYMELAVTLPGHQLRLVPSCDNAEDQNAS